MSQTPACVGCGRVPEIGERIWSLPGNEFVCNCDPRVLPTTVEFGGYRSDGEGYFTDWDGNTYEPIDLAAELARPLEEEGE